MKVRIRTSKAPTKLVLHNIRTFRNNPEQLKQKAFNKKKKEKRTTKSKTKRRRRNKKKRK
jgi:hypothetical protein